MEKKQKEEKTNTAKAKNSADKKLPKVTRYSNLADVIFKYPQVAEILIDYGLHCVGCFASAFDTISDASKIHGMSEEEVDQMIIRVNELIETGE
jgi:hybrid cluster-associated redox disulfide protein